MSAHDRQEPCCTFTPRELSAIQLALVDAYTVLAAVNGGTVQHPVHGVAEALDLTDEMIRVDAALMLVSSE
jgi:hypothetical protein